jgi:hypothetical protein
VATTLQCFLGVVCFSLAFMYGLLGGLFDVFDFKTVNWAEEECYDNTFRVTLPAGTWFFYQCLAGIPTLVIFVYFLLRDITWNQRLYLYLAFLAFIFWGTIFCVMGNLPTTL